MCIHCNDLIESMIFRNWFSLATIRKQHRLYGWPPACDGYRSAVKQYYSHMEKAWQWGRPKSKPTRRRVILDAWHLIPDFRDWELFTAIHSTGSAQHSIRFENRWGWQVRHPAHLESPVTGASTTQRRVTSIE